MMVNPETIKLGTAIQSWNDWPDDVRQMLWQWNKTYRVLRFPWLENGAKTFKCSVCLEICESQRYGTAEMFGKLLCDECLIVLARAGRETG